MLVLCLSTDYFYHMCLKWLPSSRINTLSGARHWSMGAHYYYYYYY